jgi:Flp pilus assembly protein protease CpaA
MSTSTLGSSKSLNGKTIGITAGAAVIVLAIIGWTAGWFGGADPSEQAAPAATTTEQPAAQSTAPAAPAAPATGTGTTQQQ